MKRRFYALLLTILTVSTLLAIAVYFTPSTAAPAEPGVMSIMPFNSSLYEEVVRCCFAGLFLATSLILAAVGRESHALQLARR